MQLERSGNKSETAKLIISEITYTLSSKLGTPPNTVEYEYMSRDGKIAKLSGIAPTEFLRDYCDTDLDCYIRVDASEESADKLVIKQLLSGEQVVICADVRHQANKMLGILDTDFVESRDMFGSDFEMSRADKIKYGVIKPYRLLSIDGAEADGNGNAVRFKVQDADGAETGADGHYTMSVSWFREYVLYAVIRKNII